MNTHTEIQRAPGDATLAALALHSQRWGRRYSTGVTWAEAQANRAAREIRFDAPRLLHEEDERTKAIRERAEAKAEERQRKAEERDKRQRQRIEEMAAAIESSKRKSKYATPTASRLRARRLAIKTGTTIPHKTKDEISAIHRAIAPARARKGWETRRKNLAQLPLFR